MARLLSLLLLLCFVTASRAAPQSLSASDWALPRDGADWVQHPVLSAAVKAMLAKPGSHLELHYPGGDEGSLWVAEVRAWLVALGVASNTIELVPGSSDPQHIDIRVVAGS